MKVLIRVQVRCCLIFEDKKEVKNRRVIIMSIFFRQIKLELHN